MAIKKLPHGLARSIIRDLLRFAFPEMSFIEIDNIAKKIPYDASLKRICGNVYIDDLPEGDELKNIVKKYQGWFNLGCKIEDIYDFFKDKKIE